MRHRKLKGRLSRNTAQRKALVKGLVRNLFISDRIKTTHSRAQQARMVAERLITLGKKDTLHSRRLVHKVIPNNEIVRLIFGDVAPRFKNRSSGYTRIIRLFDRKGDGASLVFLELVEKRPITVKEKKKKKTAVKAKPEPTKAEAKPKPKKIEKKAEVEPKQAVIEKKPEPPTEAPKEKQVQPPKKEEKKKGGFFKGLGGLFKKKPKPEE